jgi:hypothetical protein
MRFQIKREWVIPVSIGVVSFMVGGASGYILGLRRDKQLVETAEEKLEKIQEKQIELDFKYDERVSEFNHMIQQAAFVTRELKEEGKKYLESFKRIEFADEFVETKESHPSNDSVGRVVIDEEVLSMSENVINIFPAVHGDDEDWNYAEEVAKRTPDAPYIIHRDEYFDNERDCSQSSLMYYAGDNILCDDHDTPVYDAERVVGKIRFGHGSKDPNICYVRNEVLDAEYEILQDPGFYQIEVLGEALAEKDLKHSKGIPKFRMD